MKKENWHLFRFGFIFIKMFLLLVPVELNVAPLRLKEQKAKMSWQSDNYLSPPVSSSIASALEAQN